MKAARKTLVAIVATAFSPGAGCSPGAPAEAPLVRIGEERVAFASPEDDALWQVRDVAESDGTFWALTASPPFVHVFGPDGVRVAQFGRKGDGPGDLRFPRALWPDVADAGAIVWDPGLGTAQRLSLGADGTRAASRSIPTSGVVRADLDDATFGNPFRARRERSGAVVLAHYDDIRVIHPDQLWLGRLVRIGRGPGAELETIVDFARDLPGAAMRPGERGQPLFLGPVPLWDICPDRRTAVFDPVSGTLYLLQSSPEVAPWPNRDSIALAWEPEPLPTQQRFDYIRHQMRTEARGEDIADSELDALAAQAARDAEDLFPAQAPLAVDILCGAGRVWLQEFDGPSHPLGYGPAWRTISLDAGATPRFARIAFPAGFSPYRISKSQALGTIKDSTGLARLALVELPPEIMK